MVETFRIRIARKLAPQLFTKQEVDQRVGRVEKRERVASKKEVDQRVAAVLSQMDPFEPLMRQFTGIFSEEYTKPEDGLNDRDRLALLALADYLHDNPSLIYLVAWIMNTQGNETLKRAPVTTERIMYGRAQISGMVLFKREIARLAQLYADERDKLTGDDFDPSQPLE